MLTKLKDLLKKAEASSAQEADFLAIAHFVQSLAESGCKDEDIDRMLVYLKELCPTDKHSKPLMQTVYWLSMLLYEAVSHCLGEDQAWTLATCYDGLLQGPFTQWPGASLSEKVFARIARDSAALRHTFLRRHLTQLPKGDYDSNRRWVGEGLLDADTACWQLSREHNLWCYRSDTGGLVLVAWLYMDEPENILADEEMFNNEIPLYFTECTHFESPVYHLMRYRKIFHSLFALLGYPAVQCSIRLVGTSESTYIINEEDMQEKDWRGQNITVTRYEAALSHPLKGLTAKDYIYPEVWEDIINCARMVFHSKLDARQFGTDRLEKWLMQKGCLSR